ncbi:MAG: hypothetical protein Q9200_004468 [Gallowayella weberi]
MPHLKKQKLCKDEATFVKGKPQAEVNYWPCEYQDEVATAEHHKYKVYPLGQIADYCKHVPYRSEKKTFLSKTGREGFHAAKAVAATFCYRIRYVLTPIFGPGFPAQCIVPGAPGFDSMHVAPQIIHECAEANRECRRLGQEPQTPPVSAGGTGWTAANIRPKPLKLIGSETGYGSDTDTDRSDIGLYSPLKPTKFGFKGLATPRSSGNPGQYGQSYVRAYAPSQTGSESDVSNDCRKRKRNPPRYINEEYDSSSTDSSEECIVPAPSHAEEESSKPRPMTDESAAKVMIAFSMKARVFDSEERVIGRRRASA